MILYFKVTSDDTDELFIHLRMLDSYLLLAHDGAHLIPVDTCLLPSQLQLSPEPCSGLFMIEEEPVPKQSFIDLLNVFRIVSDGWYVKVSNFDIKSRTYSRFWIF